VSWAHYSLFPESEVLAVPFQDLRSPGISITLLTMSRLNNPSLELLGFRQWCEFLCACIQDMDLGFDKKEEYKEWIEDSHARAAFILRGDTSQLRLNFREMETQRSREQYQTVPSSTMLELTSDVHRNHLFPPALRIDLPWRVVNPHQDFSFHLLRILQFCQDSLVSEMQIPGEQWSDVRRNRFQEQREFILSVLGEVSFLDEILIKKSDFCPFGHLNIDLHSWKQWIGLLKMRLGGASFSLASTSSFHPNYTVQLQPSIELSVLALDGDGVMLESLRWILGVHSYEQRWLGRQSPGSISELSRLLQALIWLPEEEFQVKVLDKKFPTTGEGR